MDKGFFPLTRIEPGSVDRMILEQQSSFRAIEYRLGFDGQKASDSEKNDPIHIEFTKLVYSIPRQVGFENFYRGNWNG
jgi:hypothetical protein